MVCVLAAATLACAVGFSLHGSPPLARAASTSQLRQRISAGQSKVSTLSRAVHAASSHLAQLSSSITGLERQIARIQADLDAKRAELLKLRSELAAARTRLAQLEAFETQAEAILSRQLVGSYESDNPDLVTVVLEASGFSDLLERLAFVQRVRNHDTHVVSEVRAARRAVAAQATRLGKLEAREQVITDAVLQQRNSLARTRLQLVSQQLGVAQTRREKAGQLSTARGQVASLQHQLSQIEAAQAAAAAARAPGRAPASSAAVSSSGVPSSASPGPSQVSSGGGFTFPMPPGDASPPGTWSLDLGVDISAAGDTPEYAVCSGTIVLHGIGGFGAWAPVLHCDSPVGGYSYVYYGHAGPANQLPVGTHVGAGQVMSSVGPGIVGISTGPHLEIGFSDSSGSPLGTQTAPTMLSLLRGAYG